MTQIIRILIIVLSLEGVICGYQLVNQLLRPSAILPNVKMDDPLINQEFYNLATKAETGTSDDWMSLAQALIGQGFYPYAELCFRQAYELDNKNITAQIGVAFCLDRMGSTSESIALFDKISQKVDGPQLEFCQYAMGCNLLREEKTDEAEFVFSNIEKSIRSDYQYGKILVRKGKAKEALKILKRARQGAPNSIKLFHFLSFAYEGLGETDLAREAEDNENRASYVVESFYYSAFIKPHSIQHGFGKEAGRLNQLLDGDNLEKFEAGVRDLMAQFEEHRSPQYEDLLFNLVRTKIAQKKPSEALSLVKQIMDTHVNDSEILELQGEAYRLAGNFDKMITSWQHALQLSPSVTIHQKLADHFKSQNNKKQMEYHLAQISFIQGKQKFHKNDVGEAKELFEKALTLDPSNEHIWFYQAECFRIAKNQLNAKISYQRCLKLNPYYGRAIAQLKRLQEKE